MADDEDVTRGGSRVIRHQARERGWEVPRHDQSVAEEVEQHMSKYGLVPQSVFHEIVSDLVHIDVHFCRPTPDRPFVTLFTTGMSDLPMTVPEGVDARLVELMLCLPSDWPLDDESLHQENRYWPIRVLKQLARLPHEYQTWLGSGHTVPNGDPPGPYAEDTALCCALIAPPLTLPAEAHRFQSSRGACAIYGLFPLFAAEVNLKLERGTDALLELFDKNGITELLVKQRAPVTRRKLFGIF